MSFVAAKPLSRIRLLVDRATEFYTRLGWRQDVTPPASDASIHFGADLTTAAPGSARDLAAALRRAAAAHGRHEERTGEEDPNWPDWYAEYMAAEQSGAELPT